MSENVMYELQYPFDFKSKDGKVIESYTQFEIKRPKGKHLKATDSVIGEAAKTLALIAACADVPQPALNELDIVDFTALGEIVEGFTKAPRRTGETSSAT